MKGVKDEIIKDLIIIAVIVGLVVFPFIHLKNKI